MTPKFAHNLTWIMKPRRPGINDFSVFFWAGHKARIHDSHWLPRATIRDSPRTGGCHNR
jgi:hypothetical protein